jgi:hypothetical protein
MISLNTTGKDVSSEEDVSQLLERLSVLQGGVSSAMAAPRYALDNLMGGGASRKFFRLYILFRL